MGHKRHPAPTPSSGCRTQVLPRLPGGSSVARVLWALEAKFPSELASAPHGGPASLPVSPRGGSAEGAGGHPRALLTPGLNPVTTGWECPQLPPLGQGWAPQDSTPTVGGETGVQGRSHSQPVAGGGGQGCEPQTPTQGRQSPGPDGRTWRGAAAPSTPPGGLRKEESR